MNAQLLARLKENDPSLTTAELNGAEEIDGDKLGKALARATVLQELSCECGRLGGVGAAFITEALEANPSLTALVLDNNGCSAPGCSMLAQALLPNSVLRRLRLTWNGADTEAAIQFGEALEQNATLTELDLSNNPAIGRVGALRLVEGLARNQSLVSLGLSNAGVDPTAAAALAGLLRDNHQLRSLDLSHNVIGDGGATSLAGALTVNTRLQHLQLESCYIRSPGGHQLAASLGINTVLSSLVLKDNAFDGAVHEELLGALKASRSLCKLSYAGMPFTAYDLCRRNKRFQAQRRRIRSSIGAWRTVVNMKKFQRYLRREQSASQSRLM